MVRHTLKILQQTYDPGLVGCTQANSFNGTSVQVSTVSCSFIKVCAYLEYLVLVQTLLLFDYTGSALKNTIE